MQVSFHFKCLMKNRNTNQKVIALFTLTQVQRNIILLWPSMQLCTQHTFVLH